MMKLKRSIRGVESTIVIDELSRVQEEHGLRPDTLLEAATPEDAPLHPAFTWDDDVAAHKYRLEEARSIIQAVHIVDEQDADQGRAFVYVPAIEEGETGQFLPTAQVAGDSELFERACEEFRRNIVGNQHQLTQLIDRATALGSPRVTKLRRVSQALEKVSSALD